MQKNELKKNNFGTIFGVIKLLSIKIKLKTMHLMSFNQYTWDMFKIIQENILVQFKTERIKEKLIDSHDMARFLNYEYSLLSYGVIYKSREATNINSLYCFGQADTTIEQDTEKVQLTHIITKQLQNGK